MDVKGTHEMARITKFSAETRH